MAKFWINILKKELDEKFDKRIPILLTTQYLILPLVTPENIKYIERASVYYSNEPKPIIIPDNKNLLGRTLIPFFRNDNYLLDSLKNEKYCKFIIKYFDENIN